MIETEFGPDISHALKNKYAEDTKHVADLQAAKARYKIEILYGSDRSNSSLKPSSGLMMIWESGKMFHGGGDDRMFWCGYDDCQWPFSSDNLAIAHVVCPQCRKEQFRDSKDQSDHIKYLAKEGRSTAGVSAMPCMVGEKLFRLPPTKLAELVVKTFRRLGSNADIYMKFCPTDIRIDKNNPGSTESIDKLTIARLRKEPVVYPLVNILKDTANGADIYQRFLAFLVA